MKDARRRTCFVLVVLLVLVGASLVPAFAQGTGASPPAPPSEPAVKESVIRQAVTQIDNRVMLKGTTGSIKPDAATNTVVYTLTDKLGEGILVRTSHGTPNLAQTYVVVGIVKRSSSTGAPEMIEEKRYDPKTPMGQPEPDYAPNAPAVIVDDGTKKEEKKSGFPDWGLYAAGGFFIVVAITLGAVLAVRSNREKQRQWEAEQARISAEREQAGRLAQQSPQPAAGRTMLAGTTGGAEPGPGRSSRKDTIEAWGTLEVIEGPDRGKTFPLARNQVVIGRDEGDIRLSADSAVSGRHAVLSRTNDGRLLYIDESTNGSMVAGKPVHHAQAEVQDGTEIQAGVSKFRLHVIAAPLAAAPAVPEHRAAPPTVFVERASAATQMFTGCELVVVAGQTAGRSITLETAEVTIGREATDVVLPDPSVSREHVSLSLQHGDYVLKNLSKFGTKVNGQDVDEHVLAAGDQIQMGEVTLEFRRMQSE